MNHKLDTDTHVYFYEQDFYVLSNFSSFQVFVYANRHQTAEHAYHYEKFADKDKTIALLIQMATSAHEAFKIAQKYKYLRNPNWDEVKFSTMKDIIRAKAEQHEYVRRKLLQTGDRILVEDSWRDDVWGWGPNKDGQNMLGKLWMEVREELRQLEKPSAN